MEQSAIRDATQGGSGPISAPAHPTSRNSMPAVVWIGSVLAFTVIFAVCFTAIKTGLAFAPPLLFGGLRALIGGATLLLVLVALRAPLLPARRYWPLVLAVAATSTTIGFGAMFLSPGRTGAGIASVLGNTQPLFALVLAAFFLGERVTRGRLVALLLGLGGVTLIAYPALAGADAYGISGAVLALAASAGASTGSVLVKRAGLEPGAHGREAVPLLAMAAWQLIIGSLPLLGASAIFEPNAGVTWNIEFIGLLLFLALLGTSFTTALWYWLLQRMDVGRLTMFLFLVPVVGLGISALVLGERVGPFEIVGAALIVAGIAAVVREGQQSGTTARTALKPPPDSTGEKQVAFSNRGLK